MNNDKSKKYTEYTEYKDVMQTYQYDRKTNTWKFTNYKCMKCGFVFIRDTSVPKHMENCVGKTTQRKEMKICGVIMDKYGREWQPLDSNLKKS